MVYSNIAFSTPYKNYEGCQITRRPFSETVRYKDKKTSKRLGGRYEEG